MLTSMKQIFDKNKMKLDYFNIKSIQKVYVTGIENADFNFFISIQPIQLHNDVRAQTFHFDRIFNLLLNKNISNKKLLKLAKFSRCY